jgi:DNA repair protein RecO (recombination protein O)
VGLYRDQGIVLRTWRLGESDRIVNLLTERHGKVRAVVKGVRKTKSRFGARLEPMVHCSLLFYEGRELDIVTQAEVVEFFRPVREDLSRLAKAASLLEATDQLCQERHSNPRLFAMLLGGLRALAAHDAPLLVPAFFLKLLSTEGFHPLLDECASCGDRYGLTSFDLAQGGVICVSCSPAFGVAVGLSPPALDLIRRVLGGDLGGALSTPAGPDVAEVERLATRAMEHHLERRLRSLPVAGALAGE